MRVTKKIFTWAAASSIFLDNVIDFFKQSLHLKNYSNSTFLCWKTKKKSAEKQKVLTLIVWREKATSICTNKFSSGK